MRCDICGFEGDLRAHGTYAEAWTERELAKRRLMADSESRARRKARMTGLTHALRRLWAAIERHLREYQE